MPLPGIAAALAIVLLAGCTPESDQRANAPAPALADAPADAVQALAPGSHEIEFDATGVRVLANGAARSAMLATLARRAGAEINGSEQVSGQFSGWFTAPTAELAVGHLAPGFEYTASYAPSAASAGHRLAGIQLTPRTGSPAVATPADSAPGTASGKPVTGERPGPDGQAARLYERWHNANDYAASLLSSADTETRIRALDEFDSEGGALVALDRALAGEGDPNVRIALLHKLDESGSVIALQSILRGLDDPSPPVIVIAIQLIQDWHDEEIVERYVAPLQDHPDADVRLAVGEAIDSVRE